ncbi:MAG: hypothetical protein ACK4GO_13405 [Gemmobacter sp.]
MGQGLQDAGGVLPDPPVRTDWQFLPEAATEPDHRNIKKSRDFCMMMATPEEAREFFHTNGLTAEVPMGAPLTKQGLGAAGSNRDKLLLRVLPCDLRGVAR